MGPFWKEWLFSCLLLYLWVIGILFLIPFLAP